MKFKENLKRFCTLNRHHDAGFTLVELIVVIAILAILAGVAVPAYSGYVTQANKTSDLTLVGEVVSAMQLQYYAEPGFVGVSSVALTEDGASAAATDTFANAAMSAAFGNSWATAENLSLRYDKWGNGAAVAQTVVANFAQAVANGDALADIYNGTATPSYAENVDELFDVLKDTSIEIGDKLDQSGAELVQGAANITMTAEITAEEFAEKWKTAVWDSSFLMGGEGVYSGDTSTLTEEALQNAVANAAVIKARNASIGSYLQNIGYSAGVYNAFFNFNYEGSSVPQDAVAVIMDPNSNMSAFNALAAELGAAGVTDLDQFSTDLGNYFANQAYTDGLAYYAMMNTVNGVEKGNTDDETYWDNMSSAVSIYGSIARGEVSLDELNAMYTNLGSVGDNSVVITLMAQNGELVIQVSPLAALPN